MAQEDREARTQAPEPSPQEPEPDTELSAATTSATGDNNIALEHCKRLP